MELLATTLTTNYAGEKAKRVARHPHHLSSWRHGPGGLQTYEGLVVIHGLARAHKASAKEGSHTAYPLLDLISIPLVVLVGIAWRAWNTRHTVTRERRTSQGWASRDLDASKTHVPFILLGAVQHAWAGKGKQDRHSTGYHRC